MQPTALAHVLGSPGLRLSPPVCADNHGEVQGRIPVARGPPLHRDRPARHPEGNPPSHGVAITHPLAILSNEPDSPTPTPCVLQVNVSSEKNGLIGSCSVKISEIKGELCTENNCSVRLSDWTLLCFALALRDVRIDVCDHDLMPLLPPSPPPPSPVARRLRPGNIPGRFFPLVGAGWRSAGELSMARAPPPSRLLNPLLTPDAPPAHPLLPRGSAFRPHPMPAQPPPENTLNKKQTAGRRPRPALPAAAAQEPAEEPAGAEARAPALAEEVPQPPRRPHGAGISPGGGPSPIRQPPACQGAPPGPEGALRTPRLSPDLLSPPRLSDPRAGGPPRAGPPRRRRRARRLARRAQEAAGEEGPLVVRGAGGGHAVQHRRVPQHEPDRKSVV